MKNAFRVTSAFDHHHAFSSDKWKAHSPFKKIGFHILRSEMLSLEMTHSCMWLLTTKLLPPRKRLNPGIAAAEMANTVLAFTFGAMWRALHRRPMLIWLSLTCLALHFAEVACHQTTVDTWPYEHRGIIAVAKNFHSLFVSCSILWIMSDVSGTPITKNWFSNSLILFSYHNQAIPWFFLIPQK